MILRELRLKFKKIAYKKARTINKPNKELELKNKEKGENHGLSKSEF